MKLQLVKDPNSKPSKTKYVMSTVNLSLLFSIVMDTIAVWLDCDPGHDDMLAIILAALNPRINLIGISTSAGNSTIENTTQNSLNILHEIGRQQIPVYKGSPGPLCGSLNVAPQIHGQSGLEGAELKKSHKAAITENSFYEIYKRIISQESKPHFVVTGAMTNLAILLKAFPNIIESIAGVTIMGGAIGLGNWSPAAQFNILVDPQAASIVFNSGIKVTMVPLEVTHTVLIDEPIFAALQQMGSQFSSKLYDLFKFFQIKYKENQNFDYPVAHDPCTIYYLLHPQKFAGREGHVEIELVGGSRGRTNCHFMHLKDKPINAMVCERVDVKHFWETMMEAISRIK